MSKRSDPNSGARPRGDGPNRVRPMTFYDRMEDARRRRHEVLAKGNGPDPRPVPSLKATNQTTPPPERETPSEPIPHPSPKPVVETVAAPAPIKPTEPTPQPQDSKPPKRAASGYWMGLFQAMAAIAIIALLFAVFSTRGAPPEDSANAAAPVTLAPVAVEQVTVETPIVADVTEMALIADRVAQSTGPAAPLAPDATTLGLTIAPLVNPVFEITFARLSILTPDSPPLIADPEAGPPLPQTVPPLVLTSTPPIPQRPTPVENTEPQIVNPGLAEATNVVLLVPAFVPQAEAEDAIQTAAALGIPVDQTRRANLSISQTNIRYFHAEDAEAATILASGLGGIARDFTNFRPPPNPGVIEIWIEGQGGSTSNQGSATARGIEADLEALRNSIQRALNIATGN